MTTQEFSNEFDILYNNIASNQAPGLDKYEKSVFLTSAQEALVLELITGKNALGDSFEKTEEARQYLSNIVKTAEISEHKETTEIKKISNKSSLFKVPEDLWFITYESVKFEDSDIKCTPTSNIEVVPVTQDEFSRIIKNPFRKPNVNRVLRLNISNFVELVSEYDIKSYNIRYISQLEPIVLDNLPQGLSVKGVSTITECKLNPALHEAILGRAVQLAQASMGLIESGR